MYLSYKYVLGHTAQTLTEATDTLWKMYLLTE